MMKTRILVLCTGNSCRSQMAEGFLRSLSPDLEVYSGGTRPADAVNPLAIRVMAESGVDISGQRPTHADAFVSQSFDYVITVCDHAKEACPVFTGDVGRRLHLGFDDPADATGTEEEQLAVYRRVRDEIKATFERFRHQYLTK